MATRSQPRLGDPLGSLGDFLAERRRQAQLSLRQVAELAGISNPYLSQVERGLRRPSAQVLQRLAKALQISAETVYVRAGILDPDERPGTADADVVRAVLNDPGLSSAHQQSLLEIYRAFLAQDADTARRPTPTVPPEKESA